MRTPHAKTLKIAMGCIALAVLLLLPALCFPAEFGQYVSLLFAGGGMIGMAYSNPLPGQRTGLSTTPRDVLYSDKGVRYGRGVIDSANSYDGAYTSYETAIRAGTLMARVTATKKWVPCKRTQINQAGGTGTTWVVDDARAFKVGDVVTIGGDTGITITAINYGTKTLTIASTTVADDDVVFCTSLAGSEIARGILNEFVNLKDEDGVNRDKTTGLIVIAGMVDPSQILGDYAACRASGVTNYLGFLQFADEAGQT